MKTQPETRFRELVKASGNPEVVALWADPKRNPAFMKMVKQRRILTLVQKPAGTKKDFGLVGFYPQPFAAYLVFPKPLKVDDDVRVIGINYDLLKKSGVKASERHQPQRPRPSPTKPLLVEKLFSVSVLRVATVKTSLSLRAKNKAEAKAQALKEVSKQPFSPSSNEVTNKAISVASEKG